MHAEIPHLSLKEQLNHKAKPVVAAASIGLGTYLLYDTIQTAIDLQKCSQQNGEKVIALNAFVAAGLICAGAYVAKQVLNPPRSS
jgi:hypothetical protein